MLRGKEKYELQHERFSLSSVCGSCFYFDYRLSAGNVWLTYQQQCPVRVRVVVVPKTGLLVSVNSVRKIESLSKSQEHGSIK